MNAITEPLLNAEQQAAVDHDDATPLLVIAGAGTGKTHTLAHRVARLVAQGADPARVLLLTFSRRAAQEMSRRVERLLRVATPAANTLPWAGTFHAIGARLLREHAEAVSLSPQFSIHDRDDAADLMNLVRHDAGLAALPQRFPLKGTCMAIYSTSVNTQAPLGDVLRLRFPWCAAWEDELRRLFRRYVEVKQEQQVLDYDDLLLWWAQLMQDEVLGGDIGARFTHVLVDEYQDTNRLQADILRAMKPDGRGVTVVGDDAQAIYAFRGATVRNILDFPDQFTPSAARVTLARNYRSTQPLLDAANAVMALAPAQFAKQLVSERRAGGRPRLVDVRDDAAQAAFVVEQVLARREGGTRLKAQAVLFRAGHHSARLEIELTRRRIPFVKFGGLKFLEAAHVKDLLAALRWARNPFDRVAGFRTLQLVAGIGPTTAARVLDNLARAGPAAVLLGEQPVPENAATHWSALCAALQPLRSADATWPTAFERLAGWYVDELPRLHDDAPARRNDIDQLARMAAGFASAEGFLADITLDAPEATSGEAGVPLRDEDYLVLSTIHSAKGQEWSAVSVLNVVDGCMPSDMATGTAEEIDEERRLLYVAMTRARDALDLLVPQRFHVTQQPALGDRHVFAGRSRFIPASLLPHFEAMTWPPAAPEPMVASHAPRPALDLAARMRAMW